jgi:hypothetical protein
LKLISCLKPAESTLEEGSNEEFLAKEMKK